jgi:type II secretory pathway pseudopilin PulG
MLCGPSGFGLIEVLLVVVAIVVMSAVVVPAMFRWISDSQVSKAHGDASAMAAAMSRFYQDTSRWPGQVEILKAESATRFLIVGDPTKVVFPDGAPGISAVTCSGGLTGVTANVTAFELAVPSASNTIDLMDFLIRKPPEADYPNWRGPYLATETRSDPWDRAWIVNVIPLFCKETVTGSAQGGAAGYGWIVSGGPNRTIQTALTDSKLNPDADDVGVNLGKRLH